MTGDRDEGTIKTGLLLKASASVTLEANLDAN